MSGYNIYNLTLTALMTAIICIFGPIVIPIGMIPLSLANFAIYLTVILMGRKKGIISILLYLLIGFIGIPVFSGFTAGAGKLLGPTGGYLIGYIALVWTAGGMIEKWRNKRGSNRTEKSRTIEVFLALITGTIVLYMFGTVWLAIQANISFQAALISGVLPFILPDIIKIWIAVVLGQSIKKRLSTVPTP